MFIVELLRCLSKFNASKIHELNILFEVKDAHVLLVETILKLWDNVTAVDVI